MKLARRALSLVILTMCFLFSFAMADEAELVEGCLISTDSEMASYESIMAVPPLCDLVQRAYRTQEYDTLSSMVLGLQSGKVDAIYLPCATARYIASLNEDMTVVGDPTLRYYYRMLTTDANADLAQRLSDGINTLANDGVLTEMAERYTDNPEYNQTDIQLVRDTATETITVAISGDSPPFDYIAADGTPIGFNVELLSRLSECMNVNFSLKQITMPAREYALSAGAVDVVFCSKNYTEEFPEVSSFGVCATEAYHSDIGAFIVVSASTQDVIDMYGIADYAITDVESAAVDVQP